MRLFTALLSVALALPGAVQAASGSGEQLQSGLQGLLDGLLGAGRAGVLVRERLEPEAPAPHGRAAGRRPGGWTPLSDEPLWDRIAGRSQGSTVLPGYSLPRDLAEETRRAILEVSGSASRPQAALRSRLEVALVLDPSVAGPEVQRALDLVEEALELDPARGDSVKVTSAPIAPTWAKSLRSPAFHERLASAAATLGVGLALLAAAGLLALGLRPRLPAYESNMGWVQDPSVEAPSSWAGALGAAVLLGAGPREAQALARLAELDGPATAVAALRELPLRAAGELFRLLPRRLQESAARELLTLRSHARRLGAQGPEPPARLREHLADLRAGPWLLEELLVRLPEVDRTGLLDLLERGHQDAVWDLRRELPTLAQLATASLADRRACLAPSSTDALALALFDVPEPIATALLDALPPVLRDLAAQRLEVLVPASMREARRERAELVARWRNLRLAGRPQSFGSGISSPYGSVSRPACLAS